MRDRPTPTRQLIHACTPDWQALHPSHTRQLVVVLPLLAALHVEVALRPASGCHAGLVRLCVGSHDGLGREMGAARQHSAGAGQRMVGGMCMCEVWGGMCMSEVGGYVFISKVGVSRA